MIDEKDNERLQSRRDFVALSVAAGVAAVSATAAGLTVVETNV